MNSVCNLVCLFRMTVCWHGLKVCSYLYFEVCRGGMSTSFLFGMPTSLLFVETWSFTVSLLKNWLDVLLEGTLTGTDDWLLFLEGMFTSLFEICRHLFVGVCRHLFVLVCRHFSYLLKHDLLLFHYWRID